MAPINVSRTVPLPSDNSDGDEKYWPNDPVQERKPHDLYYHEALARLCPDLLPPGTVGTVRFERMPGGYETFLKTRNDSKHTDRYLYGHPKGKFDSPNKFALHFRWLMEGQQGPCRCVNCNKSSKASVPKAPKIPRAPKSSLAPEPAVPITRTSIEQVKNAQKYLDLVYTKFQDKKGPVALEFTTGEPEGWQYRIFNQAEEYNNPVLDANSFEPRENEIVLFYRENLGLYFEEKSQAIGQLKSNGEHGLTPKWQAGRIISTPTPGTLIVDDLKYWKTNPTIKSKLFTVEVISTTNTISIEPQRYKLPLMNFRPFSMVAELLHGLEQKEWEKNITHAGTLSTSVGLVEPCAVWRLAYDPSDKTFDVETKSRNTTHLLFQCRQMWLGPEKIVQGDVVRLLPETNDTGIETALLVKSLGYRMLNLENADPDCDAYFCGRHMTTKKPSPGAKPFLTSKAEYRDLESMGFPKSMRGYNWYDVNGERDDNYSVPPKRVVGRCYEKVAMQVMVWAGDIDIGLKGVTAMRKWGRKHTDHVDFVWAAPRHEKGVRFHLDDRLEMGANRKKSLQAVGVGPRGGSLQNGHSYAAADDKSRVFSDTASESEHMNKMSIISDQDQDEQDSVSDTFMREALEESGEGSKRGSDDASEGREEDDGVREVMIQTKKARLG